MKKLMKAIAFATVMCMLLSVSAFASTAVLDENADRTFNITVTYEGLAAKQVALLVVKAGKQLGSLADTDILYIDQKAAADGTATFTAPIAEGYDGNVDVYAGYDGRTGVDEVGKNLPIEVIEEAAVVIKGGTLKEVTGAGLKGTGYGFGMDVEFSNIPEGYELAGVIFGVTANGQRRYTEPQTYVAGLEGDLSLGVTFLNENKLAISEPSAIFFFTKADSDVVRVFTRAEDEDEENK